MTKIKRGEEENRWIIKVEDGMGRWRRGIEGECVHSVM